MLYMNFNDMKQKRNNTNGKIQIKFKDLRINLKSDIAHDLISEFELNHEIKLSLGLCPVEVGHHNICGTFVF